MSNDPQSHHRRSIRLKGYDYTQPGAYFVTIVTYQRECIFGVVEEGMVQLSGLGRIADECWRAIPEHFPHVELGAYVVMPNHVHGIIILNDHRMGTINCRGTIYRAPPPTNRAHTPTDPASTEQYQKPVAGSLATILRTYKAAVSRLANRVGARYIVPRYIVPQPIAPLWQRNYYEHIIRNDAEHARIHDYIASNPARWTDDDENPGRAH